MGRRGKLDVCGWIIQADSKLLSGFPFMDHVNPDNNLESLCIKMDLKERGWSSMDWINLAQDRDQWRALVNTVMNLRVP
jgi:hypothetical protein